MGSLIMPDDFKQFDKNKKPASKNKKPASQNKRRALARESARRLLESAGIGYHTNNGGIHLIVSGYHGFIDLWPGTEKWRARQHQMDGFGTANLIEMIESGIL